MSISFFFSNDIKIIDKKLIRIHNIVWRLSVVNGDVKMHELLISTPLFCGRGVAKKCPHCLNIFMCEWRKAL